MGSEFRTREERKQEVLFAASELLESSSFSWHGGLTFEQMESATGIDRGQISRDFGSKRELVRELVAYCIEPDVEEWTETYTEPMAAIMADSSRSLRDKLVAIGDLDDHLLRSDKTVNSQMALWALASDDSDVVSQLRSAYRFYDDDACPMWKQAFSELQGKGLSVRGGLDLDEFVTVLTALVEGLAIRSAVEPEAVTPHLTGRVMVALVESLLRAGDAPTAIGDDLDNLGV